MFFQIQDSQTHRSLTMDPKFWDYRRVTLCPASSVFSCQRDQKWMVLFSRFTGRETEAPKAEIAQLGWM